MKQFILSGFILGTTIFPIIATSAEPSCGDFSGDCHEIQGKGICDAPDNIGVIHNDNSVSCECDTGFTKVGTWANDEGVGPNPAMCAYNWTDSTIGSGTDNPDPPTGDGNGNADDDVEPICTPDELIGKLEQVVSEQERCLDMVEDEVTTDNAIGMLTAFGMLFVNPGTSAIASGGNLLHGLSGIMRKSEKCQMAFCDKAKEATVECGYPRTMVIGALGGMCRTTQSPSSKMIPKYSVPKTKNNTSD